MPSARVRSIIDGGGGGGVGVGAGCARADGVGVPKWPCESDSVKRPSPPFRRCDSAKSAQGFGTRTV